jgi:hypothetical protein
MAPKVATSDSGSHAGDQRRPQRSRETAPRGHQHHAQDQRELHMNRGANGGSAVRPHQLDAGRDRPLHQDFGQICWTTSITLAPGWLGFDDDGRRALIPPPVGRSQPVDDAASPVTGAPLR